MIRYPNYITFAWQRISDGDMEIVGTLNGETIDEDAVWNHLVEQTLWVMQLSENDVKAYHREDCYSVIENDGTSWKPLKIGR
jgi:hypothetical protein